ncbi:MAG TPA: hypothetical protein VHZ97_28725 [Pseudonocardiaceae bacterium]|jgi:hypothetical protein|nr:hypothetical protein [Pseudonocardiaceae bacterium]
MFAFTVHVTLAGEIRPTQAVFRDEEQACAYAAAASGDDEVLTASVVRFSLGELGTRSWVALFVEGARQQLPYVSDCRTLFGGGRKAH